MADPVVVMPPCRNLEPDVVAVARRLLPPGIELRLVPAEGLAEAPRPRRVGNAYATSPASSGASGPAGSARSSPI
jgi:hypothetical protein